MRIFEYTKKSNLQKLSPDQQKFVVKMIMRDVKQLAEKKQITEPEAYALYATGLYGGDRMLSYAV